MQTANTSKKALIDQVNNAIKLKQNIGKLWSSVVIIKEIIKSHCTGAYVINSIVLVALSTALLYLINPMDLIPDAIPGVGYSDDAAVILATLQQFNDVVNAFKIWKGIEPKLKQSSEGTDMKEQQLSYQQINSQNNFSQQNARQNVAVAQADLSSNSVLQEIKQVKRHYQRLILIQKINLEQICFTLQEQQKQVFQQIRELQKSSTNYQCEYKVIQISIRRLKDEVGYMDESIKQMKLNDKKLKTSRERIQNLQKDLENKNNRPYINFIFGCLLTILLLYI